jgi:hypothetical protein
VSDADPPRPIPPFLQPPHEAPLLDGDMVLVCTRDELRAIGDAMHELGFDPSMLRIVHRDGSPWIEFAAVRMDRHARAWIDRVAVELEGKVQRFALWRYTLSVFRIEDTGAIEDDEPVWTPEP